MEGRSGRKHRHRENTSGSKNIVTLAVLADLHWGATDIDRFELELESCLFDRLRKTPVDAVIIAGDTFDMKEYFPSRTVKKVLTFFLKLIDLGVDVIVIEGTRGHDALQTKILDTIFAQTNYSDKIHFYQTVTDITYRGMNILLLPEEYIRDASLYYEDYFNRRFDLIIGHGMIDKIWYAKETEEKLSASHATQTPVFSVDKLEEIGKYIYFGHVHEHKVYGKKKRFRYVGPTTRWEFDKEWNPGYYIVQYDIQTKLAIEEFVINDKAPILLTKSISISTDLPVEDITDLIGMATSNVSKSDRLRVIVQIKRGLKTFESMKNLIMEMLRNYPTIYPVLKLSDFEENEDEVNAETPEERNARMQEHTKTPEDERIQSYIKERNKIEVSLDDIRDIIGYEQVEGGESND